MARQVMTGGRGKRALAAKLHHLRECSRRCKVGTPEPLLSHLSSTKPRWLNSTGTRSPSSRPCPRRETALPACSAVGTCSGGSTPGDPCFVPPVQACSPLRAIAPKFGPVQALLEPWSPTQQLEPSVVGVAPPRKRSGRVRIAVILTPRVITRLLCTTVG
ncbi:unnamed protein product [Ascophyllum nodosum]